MPPRYIKLSAILAKENLSVIDVHVGALIGVGGLPPRYIKWSVISAKANLIVIDVHIGFLIGLGGLPPGLSGPQCTQNWRHATEILISVGFS